MCKDGGMKMMKNFEITLYRHGIKPTDRFGEIHVAGALPQEIKEMNVGLQKLDSARMLYSYSLVEEDTIIIAQESQVFTWVANELTDDVYLAKAVCKGAVSVADIVGFIVSTERHVKEKITASIRNLAVNCPEHCARLLTVAGVLEPERFAFVKFGALSSRTCIDYEQDDFSFVAKQILGENYSENWIENFVRLCNYVYNKEGDLSQVRMLDRMISNFVNSICSGNEATMVNFMRAKSHDRELFKSFAYECLDPDLLSSKANVIIYIRRKLKEESISKNYGHFRVFTVKDGKEKLLKFGNEMNNVYMLMYLIDRVKEPERKHPISLEKNKDEFKRLYLSLFSGLQDSKVIDKRIKEFSVRTDKNGVFRSGRKGEYIKAIRKQMQEQFEEYGESYLPYIMTTDTHLHVPASKIVFDNSVKDELMGYNFI